MLRQDFLLRALSQLGEALARAAGLKRKDPEQALAIVRAAKAALPVVPGLLENTAPSQLPSMLGSPELCTKLADLFELESQLLKEQGDTRAALRALQRAAALRGTLS